MNNSANICRFGKVTNSCALFENKTHASAGKSCVSGDSSARRYTLGNARTVIAISLPMMLGAVFASIMGRRAFARVTISATYVVIGASTLFLKSGEEMPVKSPIVRQGANLSVAPDENR